jgi:hypothetical protein
MRFVQGERVVGINPLSSISKKDFSKEVTYWVFGG